MGFLVSIHCKVTPFSVLSHQPPMDRLGPTVWGDGAFPRCLRNGSSSCSLGPGPLDGKNSLKGWIRQEFRSLFVGVSCSFLYFVASWTDLDFARWLKHVLFLSTCGSSAGLDEMHLRIVHSGTWRDSTCPNIAIIYTTSWRNEMNDTSYVLNCFDRSSLCRIVLPFWSLEGLKLSATPGWWRDQLGWPNVHKSWGEREHGGIQKYQSWEEVW